MESNINSIFCAVSDGTQRDWTEYEQQLISNNEELKALLISWYENTMSDECWSHFNANFISPPKVREEDIEIIYAKLIALHESIDLFLQTESLERIYRWAFANNRELALLMMSIVSCNNKTLETIEGLRRVVEK